MSRNERAIAFLATLLVIVFFLMGFRLGKGIAEEDRKYVPPTAIPNPTNLPPPSPTITREEYLLKKCKIVALLPTDTIKNTSTVSAIVRNKSLLFNCNVQYVATNSAIIKSCLCKKN
ncbi:hypothetical protein A3D80_02755 [Candidatus Roizmanbacteria bacterium RIFCSPHIGHO2_02_FULL_40_13b]|nr:MAG: hypothetical protein A3D80_02755 [Candidatus Roizmanbacteria bacterium RIFCSPHIGHO2_02_FULL_40_13b]OGK49270.1 MAG: hypothetical protein A3A56_00585 [Candidatus Roizmanbacteria bacterium RIFCSPLOWO2_01_FULL_40_32]